MEGFLTGEPQAGRLRTIHPIGGAPTYVGRPDTAGVEMDNSGYYDVEKTETRLSVDGQDSVEFRAGQRITAGMAARFGFVTTATPFVGARPADEVPDIAPTELEKRGLGAAPENRAEPAARETKKG